MALVQISPGLARSLLDRGVAGPEAEPDTTMTAQVADAILGGSFSPSSAETVVINPDGTLGGGRHVLSAIVLSGQAVMVQVTGSLDAAAPD